MTTFLHDKTQEKTQEGVEGVRVRVLQAHCSEIIGFFQTVLPTDRTPSDRKLGRYSSLLPFPLSNICLES